MELGEIATAIGLPINSKGKIEFKCTRCKSDKGRIYIDETEGLIIFCRDCKTDLPLDEVLKAYEKPKPKPPPPKTEPKREQYDKPSPELGAELFREKPPQSEEAEMALLGSIFFEPEAIADPARGNIIETLPTEELYFSHNRIIFDADKHLYRAGRALDPITVVETLRALNLEDQLPGGLEYLRTLANAVPTAINIKDWADIIHSKYIRRKKATEAHRVIKMAYNGASDEEFSTALTRLGEDMNGTAAGLTLIKKSPELLSWHQLQQRRETRKREWVVDGLLARKEDSMWSGKVEGGKTTTVRTGCLCVVRADEFLGRATSQGRVLYVMMDADGEDATYEEFDRLGMTDEDAESIQFMFEPNLASMRDPLGQLAYAIRDFDASLVVLDPYARLQKIPDFNDYTATYFMAELSELAKQTNSHLILIGHVPRGREEDADVATAGLGSVSLTGSVNARLLISKKKENDVRTIRSSKGKGGGFRPFEAEFILDMDEESHWVTLGKPYGWKEQAGFANPKVLDWLNSNPDQAWTATALARELGTAANICRTAANSLYGAQQIKRKGKGTKGKPWVWASLKWIDPDDKNDLKEDEASVQ